MKTHEEDKVITTALHHVGIEVSSVFDLLGKKEPYPLAIPILLEYLPRVQDHWIIEGIARALSVKEARGKAGAVLVAQFRAIPSSPSTNAGVKWAIANALSVVGTDADFGGIVDLVRNKQHGKSREMLALALGNMSISTSAEVLIELLRDDEVSGHAVLALGKLKAAQARPQIELFLTHPKSWVRKAASQALKKLDV